LMLRCQTLRSLTPVRLDQLALVAGGANKHADHSAWVSQDCEDTLSATSKYC